MKRNKRMIIILLVLVLIAAAIWYFRFRKEENTLTLTIEKPHYGYIGTSVMATGTVQPVDTVVIGSQVSGTIKKIFADFNSVVKKGQLLAQIDPSLFIAQVQQQNATLQQAKNNLVYEQANYNRQNELYKAGAISKAELETAQNAYKVAQDQVNGAAAQLTSAQKNLSFTNIYSPIDGTVMSRAVSEGQTVASSFNTPTLFSIAKDLTKMQVRAAVDEADIGNVKVGERVTFTVDAFPNDVFNGTVQEIRLQPTVSSNVVTYTTIINAPNDNLKLKPGMTANINIYTEELDKALLIPAAALKYTPDAATAKQFKVAPYTPMGKGNTAGNKPAGSSGDSTRRKTDSTGNPVKHGVVWLKRGDSLVHKWIETGLTDDINVQVVKGLTENDEVVTAQQVESKGTSASASSGDRSPFMPQRRGGSRSGGSSNRSGGGPPPR
ncbi:efflux transporter periplasmic adaptor subunit [Niabella ginsenosidivorans]|uniref:Efflux transporter periplasmic adaptor subunit n=1 Tax=Niabella ginsenosidivorans TaxID=1176587 RepID=A0A1A9I9H7_9BACT|nr:efflux RND transporter periplasmic adaptor subunit [Niabella ginsenosidivorans]ANH83362.1 efflux transporter periplasmic adaptor subunit [Niabella ginsenosidivorans]